MLKKLVITMFVMSVISFTANTQIISTIAGKYNLGAGYSGDSGQATLAQMNSPVDVIFDKKGNLYIADRTNNVVRKVDKAGIITTIAGTGKAGYNGDGGQATVAELSQVFGIIIDSIGDMYISDESNNRIRKIDTLGIITTVAGNGVQGYAGDGGDATAAEMNTPCFMTFDAHGNLVFADFNNQVIRKINSAGIITTIGGNNALGRGYSGDGGQATNAQLNYPESVTSDMKGNLYIGDAENNVIRKIDTAGIISTIAGNNHIGYSGDSGAAMAAKLNGPCGITFDSEGNLYFADQDNEVVRVIDTNGIIYTVAGNGNRGYSGDGGPAMDAEMDAVSAIAFDNSGNMYLADEFNNVIREVTSVYTNTNTLAATGNTIIIYPNPTTEYLNIRTPQLEATDILIADITGQSFIYYSLPQTRYFSLNVSSLAEGIYFITIKTKESSITQKFIKQNH